METVADSKTNVSNLGFIVRHKGIHAMISKARHILHRLGETDCDGAGIWRDPLSHPQLSRMSSRELGDLPLSERPPRHHR